MNELIQERDLIRKEIEELRDILEILQYELEDIEEELEENKLRIV